MHEILKRIMESAGSQCY